MSREKIKKIKKKSHFFIQLLLQIITTLFSLFVNRLYINILYTFWLYCILFLFLLSFRNKFTRPIGYHITTHALVVSFACYSLIWCISLRLLFYLLAFVYFARPHPPVWEILEKSMLICSLYDKQHDTVIFSPYSSR